MIPTAILSAALASFARSDLFILVYSVDNYESYMEVMRLREQILESKASCKTRTAAPPMIIAGNKADRPETEREVLYDEVAKWVSTVKKCAFLETSAKKNGNINELFQTLFELAKLPPEMSPSLHRRVSIGDQAWEAAKKGISFYPRGKQDDNPLGVVSPHARRPSLRSDLIEAEAKAEQEQRRAEKPSIPKISSALSPYRSQYRSCTCQ
ncbi:RASD2 [Branchiostoma lanceolatum]|uniref:RASD2 protein n=1 Tax=Branchiostoma lanceolatum TaxID=7740 RepID=A0A8K0ACP1_BRALA|nr:RASD2 [Branchiostoma lanceolatum]